MSSTHSTLNRCKADCIPVTTSVLFSGCPLPTRKVRRGLLYLDIRLSPTLSFNFLLSEFNTRDVKNHSGPQKSCVLSNSQALGYVLPCLGTLHHHLLLIHLSTPPAQPSVNTSCSTICHAPPTSALIWVSLHHVSQSTHSIIFTHSVPVSSMGLSSMRSGAMFCSSCYPYTLAGFLSHNR